ncbi:MAG: ABC transporter permease [Pseudomonadota bacterium]
MAPQTPTLPNTPYKRRFQNLRTITALILREMSSTYGRSPGGYIWAVIEPVLLIVVMAVAFSLLLRSPSLGTNFVLFYATAMMPFRMYQECQSVTSSAVRYSQALLVYPVVSFADALLARVILAFLKQAMVSYLVLGGIIMVLDVRLVLDFGPILISFVLAALLGFGVGSLNCLLFDMFPVWKSLFSAATRPLMIMSAIIYIYEDVPRIAQDFLWYNPLAHISGLVRTGFYDYYQPTYISIIYVVLIALFTLCGGLLLLRRHYRKLMVL